MAAIYGMESAPAEEPERRQPDRIRGTRQRGGLLRRGQGRVGVQALVDQQQGARGAFIA